MIKQVMTIFISDSGMRLMLTDGKQITDWSEINFDPGQIEGSVVGEGNADKVAAQIKQVLDLKSVNIKKVLVAISGIRCLTRPIILPKLPREILDEAVRREAVRLLPVPLDELYMSYQSIAAPEGKTQVFLVAIPKRILDPLISTLDKADLKPVFMDIKPLLLARIATDSTAILIDVQKADFDIVIMVNGVPQPIRTIPFSLENQSREERMSMIREELERTVTFYNSNNPDAPLGDKLPVQVTGYFDDAAEFCRLLAEEVKREVRVLVSPMNNPEGFVFTRYMANVGLLLQENASGKKAGPSVVSINTLPLKYQPQPVSSMNILKMLGIAFAVLLVIGMGIVYQGTASGISSKKLTLETSRTLLQQKQLETQIFIKQINDLKTSITGMETLQTNLTNALTTLEATSLGLNLDIAATVDSAPGSIQLTQITHENGELIIGGIGPKASTVDGYISELFSTGRFSDIQIAEMNIQEDTTQAFTLRGSLLTNTDWVSSIGVILGNLPGTITLQFAATDNRELTLTGNSHDENVLMRYLEKLDTSGKFSSIDINQILRMEDESFDFSVVLRIGE